MTLNLHRSIRILQLEGDVRDADRVQLHLFKAGLRCGIQRVDTRDAFLASLHQYWPDAIVIGNDVPTLDGQTALEILHREAPHLPVIFVVMDRLEGLATSLRGAVARARAARAHQIAEAAAHHERLRVMRAASMEAGSLFGLLPPCAESSALSPP